MRGSDIRISYRECPYGGHMLRILDVGSAARSLEARLREKLRRLSARKYSEDQNGIVAATNRGRVRVRVRPGPSGYLTHQQTCLLLGIYSVSVPSMALDDPLPLNISAPDQL